MNSFNNTINKLKERNLFKARSKYEKDFNNNKN